MGRTNVFRVQLDSDKVVKLMEEWICLKCYRVFLAGSSYAKCCGEIELFLPEKHVGFIIGSSNSWYSLHEKWKNHPLYKEVSDELSNEGCYSAWIHMSSFIERLLEKNDNWKDTIEEAVEHTIKKFEVNYK